MNAMSSKETYDYINEDLRPLAYPIEKLELLPGNPRRGKVDAVAKSLKQFGQRKPVNARRREGTDVGVVLAGNTTLKAAKMLGWTHIAVSWTEDDDKTAAAFAIADNRTHDLGEYDDEATIDMIRTFEDDLDLIEASGYDLMEIEDIVQQIEGADEAPFDLTGILDDEEDEPAVTPERPTPKPVIQTQLVFDNEAQQQRWFKFVRWLKSTYDDYDTVAARLDEFLQSIVED